MLAIKDMRIGDTVTLNPEFLKARAASPANRCTFLERFGSSKLVVVDVVVGNALSLVTVSPVSEAARLRRFAVYNTGAVVLSGRLGIAMFLFADQKTAQATASASPAADGKTYCVCGGPTRESMSFSGVRFRVCSVCREEARA